jgi:succinoglycan biosynthesis transport protein ExoP
VNVVNPSQPMLDGAQVPLVAHGASLAANPLLIVHTHLRGRYVMTILLAALLAVPCGIAGYFAMPPMYASEGSVTVAMVVPKLMYDLDENRPMPAFDAFIATQANILTSRRVLEKAVADVELQAAGWPSGPAGVAALRDALKVAVPRRGHMITLTAEHGSPLAAQRAVNAVLKSYAELQEEMSGTALNDKEKSLLDLQQKLQRELDVTQDLILERKLVYGTDDLDQLYSAKWGELFSADAEINSLQSSLAVADDSAEAPQAVTVAQLAQSDAELSRLLQEQAKAAFLHRSLSATLGPEHRDMKALADRRQTIAESIDERVRVLSEQAGVLGGSAADVPTSREQLERAREQKALELERIAKARQAMGTLQVSADGTRASLAEVARQLDRYEVERENAVLGRVSIAQEGELPTSPSTDRRLPLAVFGAGAGAGLAVGGILLFGLLRGGFRYIDQLEDALTVPFLGAIPDLSVSGPAEQALAGRSIHQLRNSLAAVPATGGIGAGRVFVVTSPHAGDGKTSLTLALGHSFASARYRTVVVDADLIGRRLSIELGLGTASGLADVLASGTLNGELRSTGEGLISVVPAGAVTRCSPESIAASDLRSVLDQLRAKFDIVLVDTGPILGSLEANLVAPMADQVVLVVSRGKDKGAVQAAMRRLRTLGALTAGLVFNRAMVRDFVQSSSAATRQSVSDSRRSRSRESNALVRVVRSEESGED